MSQMAPGVPLSPEGRVTTAERLVLEELQAIRAILNVIRVHLYTAERDRQAAQAAKASASPKGGRK